MTAQLVAAPIGYVGALVSPNLVLGTPAAPYTVRPSPASRLPDPLDDATHGYLSTDVWQVGGTMLTPASLVQSGAVWGRSLVQPGAAPGDNLGVSNVAVAYGSVAMFSGYTGPAVYLAFTSGGTATTRTVNILPSGLLDVASLYAALGAADAGTAVQARWADQTGRGNHSTAISNVATPQIGHVRVGGFEAMSVGWNGGVAGLAIPSAVTVQSQNFGVYSIGRYNNSGTNAVPVQGDILFEVGDSSQSSGGATLYSTIRATATLNQTNGGSNTDFPVSLRSDVAVLSLLSTGTNVTLWQNEDAVTWPATMKAQTLAGGHIGYGGAFSTYKGNGAIAAFMVTTGGTIAQHAATRASIYARMNLSPQTNLAVYVVGDSRAYGVLNDDGENWPAQMIERLSLLGYAARLYNGSVAGIQAVTAVNSTVPTLMLNVNRSAFNIGIVHIGTNDFGIGELSVGAVLAAYQSIAAQMKVAGIGLVIFCKETHRNDTGSTISNQSALVVNTSLDQLRAMTTPAVVGCDVVIDPMTIPALADPTNSSFFPDGLHFSTTGAGGMGAYVADQIRRLVGVAA
jgi:lysophospholipase L1-like esterase